MRPAATKQAVRKFVTPKDTIIWARGCAAPVVGFTALPVNGARHGHQMNAWCGHGHGGLHGDGHRASGSGHNGIKHGHHAESGDIGVATGPAKKAIIMIRSRGASAGGAPSRQTERRAGTLSRNQIPTPNDK